MKYPEWNTPKFESLAGTIKFKMNLQQGDILIRKNSEGDTIWLSERLVIDVCGIGEGYFRKRARPSYKKSVQPCYRHHNILPATGKSWRWAKINGGFYYDLAAIPNRKPTYYRNAFGDATELVKNYQKATENKQISTLETNFKRYINRYYKDYLHCYSEEKDIHRIALAKACAAIEFILHELQDYPGTANAIYNDLSPILSKLDLRYIPHNPLRLKEKVQMVQDGTSIADVIQLPRKGNSNAEQYNDPEVWSWVMQMRQMPQNFSNEHIIRQVKDMCYRTGKKAPNRRWFGMNIFEDPKTNFLTANKRFGSSNKSQVYRHYIPYQNALYAGDCWQIDATRINMIGHKAKDGKERFLFVMAVRDVHSGDVLGYSFDYAENHLMFARAMKMACETAGYLPYELVTDRFPGHNSEAGKNMIERLETMGVQVTISHSANAKAGVERWFGTLQSVVLMGNKYYYGEGVQSRRINAHRSPEYLKEIKKISKQEDWDVSKARREAETCVEQWREIPYSYYSRKHAEEHRTPKQLHEASLKPHVIYIEQHSIDMLFGLHKEITIKNSGMINTEISKMELCYMISDEDYEVISNYHGKKVVLSYDYEDLSRVFLYEKHGSLLKFLCQADEFIKPQKYGPQKEMSGVGIAQARAALIDEYRKTELENIIAPGEDTLMLGRYGAKDETNSAEDYYALKALSEPIKKASGYDYEPDDFDEESFLRTNKNNY